MANNIPVLDGAGASKTIKTTETGGVHVWHHNVDSLPADPFGANADAAITTDTTGSVSGKLRGLVKWAFERMPASLGQKTKAASLPVVLASDQDAISISAVAAGENHLGEVGGRVKVITGTPTIVPAAAYASGDIIGDLVTFASVTRIATGSGIIRSATLTDKAKQSVALDVILFDANPSASTFTDNAAAAVNAADLTKIIGVISFVGGDYVAFSANSAAHKNNLAIPLKLASGSDIYAVFVSRGAPTYASSSDLNLRLAIDQN